MSLNSAILVSIIIPSYNSGKFIEETILSLLNQSYKNIECIIIDGGSSDETVEVIKKYEDKIKYWVSEKDRGQSDAINKGYVISKGELVTWLGADDVLHPKCVENVVNEFHINNKVGIIYGNIIIIDEHSKEGKAIKFPGINYLKLFQNNGTVAQPGSFCNRKMLNEDYFVNTDYHYCMDLELWFRIGSKSDIIYIDKLLAYFRIHENSKSGSKNDGFVFENMQISKLYGRPFFSYYTLHLYKEYFKRKVKRILKHLEVN